MSTPSEFTEALSNLDAEIEAAEAHLAGLRLKRTGAEAFLEYMSRRSRQQRPTVADSAQEQVQQPKAAPPAGNGPTEIVWSIFTPDIVISVDDAHRIVRQRGHDITREQTRNALHYLVRKQLIETVGRRGAWRLRNSEGPAGTGPSVGTPTDTEGGEAHEEDAPQTPTSAEHQPDTQLGTSIAG